MRVNCPGGRAQGGIRIEILYRQERGVGAALLGNALQAPAPAAAAQPHGGCGPGAAGPRLARRVGLGAIACRRLGALGGRPRPRALSVVVS